MKKRAMKVSRQDVISAILIALSAPAMCYVSDHSVKDAPTWSIAFSALLLAHTYWRYIVRRERQLRREAMRRWREDAKIIQALRLYDPEEKR